jgi:hypothetical protein
MSRKMKIALKALFISVVVFLLSALVYNLLRFHFDYGSIDDNFSEGVYLTLYAMVIITFYTALISAIALLFFWIAHLRRKA